MSRILKFNRFSHCFNTSDKQIQRRNSLDTQVCLAFWGLWMLFLLTKAGQNSVQNGTTAAEAFKIFIKVQVWRNSIVWLLLEVYTELFIWETFVGFHRWKRWNPSSMGTAGNSFGEESYHVDSLLLYLDHLQFHCDRCLKSPHGPSCEYPVFCFQHVSSNFCNPFTADVWGAVTLAPPRPSSNQLAVEFVGDSITAGWKVPHDFGCRCQTARLGFLKL